MMRIDRHESREAALQCATEQSSKTERVTAIARSSEGVWTSGTYMPGETGWLAMILCDWDTLRFVLPTGEVVILDRAERELVTQ